MPAEWPKIMILIGLIDPKGEGKWEGVMIVGLTDESCYMTINEYTILDVFQTKRFRFETVFYSVVTRV